MNLALGTAQFGLDYGVSNVQGRTPPDEVERILTLAHEQEIRVIDTAALYGISEEILGGSLHSAHEFKLVTKTPQFKKSIIDYEDARYLKEVFTTSLQKLRQPKVYGLLVHHADDLLAEGGEYLIDVMIDFKARGLVEKIGVSVYTCEQIDRILERYEIDLVQVPINVFDQRFLVSGKLKQLKSQGIEVHARSIFLQGLLLMPIDRISEYFAPLYSKLSDYQAFLQTHGLSSLQGALAFATSCHEITEGILGVCSTQELLGILDAWRKLPEKVFDFSKFASDDERMISPALWPRLK